MGVVCLGLLGLLLGLFPPIGLPCPTASCFVMFGCGLLEACSFLKEDEGGWGRAECRRG